MKKQHTLLEQLHITLYQANTKQILTLFFGNSPRNACHTFSFTCMFNKDVGAATKIFKAYISMNILGRAMKLSIQALQ